HNFAHEIVIKTEGKDALSYLEKECKASGGYPELILLDLKMPSSNGFDFLKELHSFCYYLKNEIIVVILTSSKDADDIIRLKDFGKYFIVNKPLNSEKLLDVHHRY